MLKDDPLKIFVLGMICGAIFVIPVMLSIMAK